MLLKNKVALITGASSGIGKATALLLAKEGAKIFFSYKENKDGAENVMSEIKNLGADVDSIQSDLIDDSAAKLLVESAYKKYGQIDILINNAGRYINGDEWDGTSDTWEQTLKQSLISAMSTSRYTIEIMRKQKTGVIVNIASRHSLYGQYDALAYAAAKAGIVNITQAYAKLMSPWGRANAVSPGAVRAGYWVNAPEEELEESIQGTLLKTIIEPEDIAETVLFLSSDKSRMITGQNIIVDAGFTTK
jgi:3-oxoacyl-[acyl-carrier protein] reductase